MAEIDLLDRYPKIQRPIDARAQASAEDRILSKRFGMAYFDGTRQQGYGGYRYDGRWKPVVQRFIEHYGLTGESRILDVGCAKGFMLHEFLEALPGAEVAGIDISEYALSQAMDTVTPFLCLGTARALPFPDRSFDLVVSIATIHNLDLEGVKAALREVMRVSRRHAFVKLGGWRTEEEKVQLYRWNVVANTFMHCDEWERLFRDAGYTGDYTWFTP